MLSDVKDKQSPIPDFKHKDLKNLEIIPHFKYNIVHSDKNCKDPIDAQSKYCFTCKQSICPTCSGKTHEKHLLLKRQDYLFYNEDFFTPIENGLNDVLAFDTKKKEVIKIINDSFNCLNNRLEFLRNEKLKHVDKVFVEIEKNFKELRENFDQAKEMIHRYYKMTETFQQINKGNLDEENSFFLMNFEMVNLFDNKNIEAFQAINKIYLTVNDFKDEVVADTHKQMREYDPFKEEMKITQMDNFYWDIISRTKTYLEQINLFKASIGETLKEINGTEKLNELVNVFDSKNKKGIDFVFNQAFFVEERAPDMNRMKRRDGEKGLSRSSSKSPQKKIVKATSNKSLTYSNKVSGRTSPMQTSPAKLGQYNISLDDKTVQRLFAYSILDTFNKYFNASADRNTYKTTLLLEDYKTREIVLKENAKPIIGTSDITVFNVVQNKIHKFTLKLDKEAHGYEKFPQGLRHILIDTKLYIIGGVDLLGKDTSNCLCIDTKTLKIEKLNPMLVPRSYHGLEYLDNYDCLIVIGGDQNYSCEIFDLFTLKWTRLPDLNYWRSNANIYYDNLTSDIYALFGFSSPIREPNVQNSDIIEVLELRDVSSGWIKVDYYKNPEFSLKLNYCSVLPFTRDKLMVYGASNSRMKHKCFALFDMKLNEVKRVTDQMLEDIRKEGLRNQESEDKFKNESKETLSVK